MSYRARRQNERITERSHNSVSLSGVNITFCIGDRSWVHRNSRLPRSNGIDGNIFCYAPFASIAKGEVFVLLYVCFFLFFLFVRSTISQQPAGRFTPYFACGRSLGRDVFSPLLGVGGPRRAEKEANEIFVTMGVNGEFLHFGGF